MARLPMFLTVEEAAGMLRIGRTKAYAMAKQWRLTGGQCGLPVVDLGGVLRVPLAQLEEFTGAHFSDDSVPAIQAIAPPESGPCESTAPPREASLSAGSPPDPQAKRLGRRRKTESDQLDLFNSRDPSD